MQFLPKITLITIVRNGAAFIERCLQSVAIQDYGNLEYILLDGASTDGTQDIIARYIKHITVYHSRPDKGPYDAQTQALKLATGDIVMLLMADDWLAPEALKKLAAMYRKTPDAQMFSFAMQEHELLPSGATRNSVRYCDPDRGQFLLEDGLYCQGINRAYARSLLTTEGYFRNDVYPQLADRDFYLRLGLLGVKRAVTQDVLYHFLVHGGSNSTGGGPEKIVRFLDETVSIAQEYLSHPQVSRRERALLSNWYCFNMLRSVWFRVRADRTWEAASMLTMLSLRYPFRLVRNIVCWRMPAPYRAKYSS